MRFQQHAQQFYFWCWDIMLMRTLAQLVLNLIIKNATVTFRQLFFLEQPHVVN